MSDLETRKREREALAELAAFGTNYSQGLEPIFWTGGKARHVARKVHVWWVGWTLTDRGLGTFMARLVPTTGALMRRLAGPLERDGGAPEEERKAVTAYVTWRFMYRQSRLGIPRGLNYGMPDWATEALREAYPELRDYQTFLWNDPRLSEGARRDLPRSSTFAAGQPSPRRDHRE